MEMFEQATRLKVRFESGHGLLAVEDLWDCKLIVLDTIARTVNRKLKNVQEESFINAKGKDVTLFELELALVKHVIAVKMEEHDKRVSAQKNREQVQYLQELVEDKKRDTLRSLTVEELESRITSLNTL